MTSSGRTMVQVDIDPGAGYCFGVEKVIRTAESKLREGETLFALGDLVHNTGEMTRLRKLGLRTITRDELPRVQSGRVLFRAHGEPPSSYALAVENNVEVLDGTCPIVLKLQQRIRNRYREMDHQKEQLVIFGKKDHPETIGLLGQVDGDATVVSSPDETSLVDPGRQVHLFSQTTMDPDKFKEVEQRLGSLLPAKGESKGAFRSACTICGQMKKRKPGLKAFALAHDVVLFVSGRHSSNGKMLYEFCRETNARTYWVSAPGELDKSWFEKAEKVGISGATSTSVKQLEAVSNQVKKLTST